MTLHNFQDSLKKSQEMVGILDSVFEKDYFILPTPLDLDKCGVDRVLVDRNDFEPVTVEYKQDSRCAQTGNAFIEICSIYRDGECQVKGWAYTCRASHIVYHDVVNGCVYVLTTESIYESIDGWMDEYKTAKAFNPGYHSVGLLVPMDVIRGLALSNLPVNT